MSGIENASFARGYPIGFVSHYPMITHDDEAIPQTGANVCIVRAPWALIEPEEDQWDFSLLHRQLEWAYQTGMMLVYLMEAGPAHAAGVRWLVEKLKTKRETMASPDGHAVNDPCYQSPAYRSYLSRFLKKTIGYLRHHPYASRIAGYSNGCEWWHPLNLSYADLDKAGFRDWLRGKYRSLEHLNSVWGTRWASWTAIEPPVLYPAGIGDLPQGMFLPASAVCDVCWCTKEESHVRVTPGQKLTFELRYTARLVAGSAGMEVAWLTAEDAKPFRLDWRPSPTGSSSGVLRFTLVVPERASRAWLLMKLRGAGKVTFHAVRVRNEKGENLAPNPSLNPAQGGWQFVAWSAGQPERVSHSWQGTGMASLAYRPEVRLEGNPRYPLAVVDDWFHYRFDSFARFIDWMAAECRSADPTRPVISYLTFAFANAFEWDYVQQMAIAVDIWAENARNQQVLGMQVNSAEGDFDSLTAVLDMVRRFGKPLWAIDLLDFTKGTYLGEAGLTRTSLSVLQHGGASTGIQYYCWYGTPDYNYSELGIGALSRMIDRVKQSAAQLEGAQPVCEVALVLPRMPLYPFLPEPVNDWADFMGWYKLLVRAGVCPDVVTLRALANVNLSGYKAVVIPDCAYIPREALHSLHRAARAGVKLLSSGRFGRYDSTGRKLQSHSLPTLACHFQEPVGKRILGQAYRLKDKGGDTPPRLVCGSGSPNFDLPQVDRVIHALRQAGVTVLARPTSATASVTLVPFRRGQERMVFALPQADWRGTITVEGRAFQVESLGSVFRNPRDEVVPRGQW